jgi:hypothetical protein
MTDGDDEIQACIESHHRLYRWSRDINNFVMLYTAHPLMPVDKREHELGGELVWQKMGRLLREAADDANTSLRTCTLDDSQSRREIARFAALCNHLADDVLGSGGNAEHAVRARYANRVDDIRRLGLIIGMDDG